MPATVTGGFSAYTHLEVIQIEKEIIQVEERDRTAA